MSEVKGVTETDDLEHVPLDAAVANEETPMGGVRDSGWGRTGPDSVKEFQDITWINSHSGQRQYPF